MILLRTSAAAPMVSLPPVGTHGRDGPARKHDTLHGEQLLGVRLLARVKSFIQPLDRTLPLHPVRPRAASRNY